VKTELAVGFATICDYGQTDDLRYKKILQDRYNRAGPTQQENRPDFKKNPQSVPAVEVTLLN